jgi:hypothetical protein
MMFAATRRLAGSSHATAARNVSRRFMSVINLSDDEAVKKFRMINNKSVLYFTATCKYEWIQLYSRLICISALLMCCAGRLYLRPAIRNCRKRGLHLHLMSVSLSHDSFLLCPVHFNRVRSLQTN